MISKRLHPASFSNVNAQLAQIPTQCGRLIYSITTTQVVSSFSISVDNDGSAFSASSVSIELYVPANSTANNETTATWMRFNENGNIIYYDGYYTLSNQAFLGQYRNISAVIRANIATCGGKVKWLCDYTTQGYAADGIAFAYSNSTTYGATVGGTINAITSIFIQGHNFPIGTVLRIRGVDQ